MALLRPSVDVRPVTEFRANTSAVLSQVHATKRPVILTQNGRSAAVLLDVDVYESLTAAATWHKDDNRPGLVTLAARSAVRTVRSNARPGTRLLSSSVRAEQAQRPDDSRGSAAPTGWTRESCAAPACNWRPRAPTTLRIVSKPGLRSPERAL